MNLSYTCECLTSSTEIFTSGIMKPNILNDEEDSHLYGHQCGNFKSCVLKDIQTIESNRHDKASAFCFSFLLDRISS